MPRPSRGLAHAGLDGLVTYLVGLMECDGME